MTAPTRPVLRYHGGKFRLAPWILSFFPEHVVYVEPFGGAASILLQKKRGVVIENKPAIEVIERMDSPSTLIYCDPPYVHTTRSALAGRGKKTHGYRHEMEDVDHEALARVLHAAKGMVVLSGYPSVLYDRDLYPDWVRHERKHIADGGKVRKEVVWLNLACAEALELQRSQQRMFE